MYPSEGEPAPPGSAIVDVTDGVHGIEPCPLGAQTAAPWELHLEVDDVGLIPDPEAPEDPEDPDAIAARRNASRGLATAGGFEGTVGTGNRAAGLDFFPTRPMPCTNGSFHIALRGPCFGP